jgi:hypothetical protein
MVCVLDSPSERTAAIRHLVEFIRQTPHRGSVKAAVKRICGELAREFPAERYETNATEGLLESQLVEKVRQRGAVVVAFVEKQTLDKSLCSWTVHLAEIAGVGAKIDSMVATVRSSASGTLKARDRLEQPLTIPPFGTATHTWQSLFGSWRDSSIRLCYSGYSQGERGGSVVVQCPEQYAE